MKKKHLLAGAALTLVAALSCAAFTGCSGSDSQAEGEKDTAAAETEYAPIAVSYLNKTYYEDIIVGDAKGFFTCWAAALTSLQPARGPLPTLSSSTATTSSSWRAPTA